MLKFPPSTFLVFFTWLSLYWASKRDMFKRNYTDILQVWPRHIQIWNNSANRALLSKRRRTLPNLLHTSLVHFYNMYEFEGTRAAVISFSKQYPESTRADVMHGGGVLDISTTNTYSTHMVPPGTHQGLSYTNWEHDFLQWPFFKRP
jgi:hypothetical protein